MASFGEFLGEFGDILKRGAEAALDLEVEERRNKITSRPLNDDPELMLRGDSGATIPKGKANGVGGSGVPPLMLALGAGVVVLAAVLIARS